MVRAEKETAKTSEIPKLKESIFIPIRGPDFLFPSLKVLEGCVIMKISLLKNLVYWLILATVLNTWLV